MSKARGFVGVITRSADQLIMHDMPVILGGLWRCLGHPLKLRLSGSPRRDGLLIGADHDRPSRCILLESEARRA